jgi:hypothetical protein
MVKMYANTINYNINVPHAKDDLYVNMINEKLHVSSAMEAIFAPMNNKRINVSPVLPPADANTVKQYRLSDPVGLPTAFVATVSYIQM